VGRAGEAEGPTGLDSDMERDYRKRERVLQPGTDLGYTIPEDTPLNRAVLKLHSGLRKAQSSVLVQARTGRIGLSKFLYNRRVPRVLFAQCRCRNGEETPQHMALFYTEEARRRQHLRTGRRLDYQQLIGTSSGAKRLARRLLYS
jgi:hypothetical protein